MKTIIAATDFSPVSLNAVNYAADLCLVTGNQLTIFHAFQVPVAYSEWPVPESNMHAFLLEAYEKLNQLKEKIVFMMAERIIVNTKLEIGEAVVELKTYCEAVSPYAVVMGSENNNVLESLLFGAKTIAALRRLSWPLIVVPPGIKFKNIRKIALATDLVNVSDTIPLSELRNLVKAFDASLQVLHASPESIATLDADRLRQSDVLLELLKDLDPQFYLLHADDVEKAITEFCESNEVDMLVIIPKKHDFISSIFRRSFSRGMVLQAHFPVMAIHE